MKQNQSFIRKIAYLVMLAVLLVGLYWIGKPAQMNADAGGELRYDPGGVLGTMRHELGLAEVQVGQIDPASSTAKLATFGMRGVAIAMLWNRANEYQKKKDWSNAIATANQLVFLEPHFTTIWQFLGWNFSYNASAEFDDYRERYRWVIRGIDFLARGLEYNTQAPRLFEAAGWTMSQKIGGAGADENQQYRRLLREDEEFGLRHDCKNSWERDNWMLGSRWYKKGEDLVSSGVSIGNKSDYLFFSNSRLNLFHYATWKRKDGIFGDEAIQAWKKAGDEWKIFGQMDLNAAIPVDGTFTMRPGVESKHGKLEETDLVREEEKQLLQELDSFKPGLREQLCIDRWNSLADTPGQQGSLLSALNRAYELPPKHSILPYAELKIIRAHLEKNVPDWQAKLQADLDTLYTAEQLALKKIPSLLLDDEQQGMVSKADGEVSQIYSRAQEMIKVNPKVIEEELQEMDGIERDVQRRARTISDTIGGFAARTSTINTFREILNYEYRFREVAVQSSQQADDAQKYRYDGRAAWYDGRVADSIIGWRNAMAEWDKLLKTAGFEDIETDAQFIRELLDIVEKFVIILDGDNKIFSDIAGDGLPMQGMIRAKLNQEHNPEPTIKAMEFAKKFFQDLESGSAEADEAAKLIFRNGLSDDADERQKQINEKAEEVFSSIAGRFEGINFGIEFMKLAPLPDIRDRQLEANALYVLALGKQGKPLPDPLPLRSFVELMMRHDPALDAAAEATQTALPLLQEDKLDEARTALEKAIEQWEPLLEKYPLIRFDPTLQTHADLTRLAALYSELLQSQEKELPENFPLKDFLPK